MREYKLIVAGSRSFSSWPLLYHTLMDLCMEGALADKSVSIVSGMARGADALGAQFARTVGVKLYEFPADWSLGKTAGFERNKAMGDFSDGLLAFWDGQSKGTLHMISYMRKLGKPVEVITY